MLHQLKYTPWTSDIDLAFYQALANLKINHDKLDSSARKVLGLYEINHRDSPERSTRMQIHANALTNNDTPKGYYRAEGYIRNYNTVEEFINVNRTEHLERVGKTIWDAISDGTIYSCPSLLCSFSAICYADLKKYRFTYHFAYPALVSEPAWRIYTKDDNPTSLSTKLESKETTTFVDAVQTWRYSVDARQHGFFLAKRLRKAVLEDAWRRGTGEIEEEEEDGNMSTKPSPKKARSSSLSELGFLWWIGSLEDYEKGFFNNAAPEDRFVCFADPSTYEENPGWMCRNLLVLVRQRWHLDSLQLLCYRDTHPRREHPTSLIFQIRSAEPVHDKPQQSVLAGVTGGLPSNALLPGQVDAFGELIPEAPAASEPQQPIPVKMPRITGWERSGDGKIRHRTVDLGSQMDPTRLADQAVDLNLKLIKWRISPSLDLDTIKHTSCLLIGAGTLGSYVSRNLMGWGVRKITFVDNGSVSYSNPVRQPLYTFKDCAAGNVAKAVRAKEALREIYPNVESEAAVMTVPMAGHPIIGDEGKVLAAFEELKRLIDSHDAIFLLMDSRESRWLPTVMAKSAGKIVINAALGFDTYMVMRHGLRLPADTGNTEAQSLKQSSTGDQPEELACYFCSDVVAPADSLKNATLDQQCTVTRPGAAPIASALAVELLVSLTQHKLKGHAPASAPPTSTAIAPAPSTDPTQPGAHPLGTVPHQIRGYMSTWQTIQTRARAYDQCAACSPAVLAAYERDGWSFVKRALNEKGFVEEISGLAEVQRLADEAAARMEAEMESMSIGDEDEEGEMI